MAFPPTPAQGDLHTENGQVWQYFFPTWRYRRRATTARVDDPSVVRDLCIPIHADSGADVTLTDQATAYNFLGTAKRATRFVDLSDFSQARVIVNQTVIGTANSRLRLLYKTGVSTATLTDYVQLGETGHVEANLGTALGTVIGKDSGWVDLAAAAKAPVWITVAHGGGDGVADPAFSLAHMYFR